MAEPEMEVDIGDMDDEAEPDEERQEDYDEDEGQDGIAERRPVLVQEHPLIIDPVLAQARLSMQIPYYPNAPVVYCIDTKSVYFAHMAYVVAHCVYKAWVSTMRWTDLKYLKHEQMRPSFQNGNGYDVLGD